MKNSDLIALLGIYLILSVVVICVLINRKIYYCFKIEQSRKNGDNPADLKRFFWEHNLNTIDKATYLFSFPKPNQYDNPLTITYIKIHTWITGILIFFLLIDVLLMLLE